jgi:hypothetical protein
VENLEIDPLLYIIPLYIYISKLYIITKGNVEIIWRYSNEIGKALPYFEDPTDMLGKPWPIYT